MLPNVNVNVSYRTPQRKVGPCGLRSLVSFNISNGCYRTRLNPVHDVFLLSAGLDHSLLQRVRRKIRTMLTSPKLGRSLLSAANRAAESEQHCFQLPYKCTIREKLLSKYYSSSPFMASSLNGLLMAQVLVVFSEVTGTWPFSGATESHPLTEVSFTVRGSDVALMPAAGVFYGPKEILSATSGGLWTNLKRSERSTRKVGLSRHHT